MSLTIIALATCVFTFLGGLFALKYSDKLHLILGFSAGAVVGVAFFDLLPESISLAGGQFGIATVTSMVALGFVVFMLLDRWVIGHGHTDDHCENENHKRGFLGAGSLSIHSFLDGLAIGLAFQVSSAVGLIVTVAVLVHDFSDGVNTVGLIIKNGGSKSVAFRFLTLDALAPVLGIVASIFIHVSESYLGLLLAVFCGFFLYIGASDLLPESHHQHPTYFTTFATILGMVVLYLAVRFAGI
ncbi:MAG: hypothetical protein RLZZ347_256 [Candidatus Parcubacteria bacterium]|jgi:ZIP family zinc transporter